MFNGKIHYKWPFSIAILSLPEGKTCSKPPTSLDPSASFRRLAQPRSRGARPASKLHSARVPGTDGDAREPWEDRLNGRQGWRDVGDSGTLKIRSWWFNGN